jgi:4-carboxymuconolactone decarboxylase
MSESKIEKGQALVGKLFAGAAGGPRVPMPADFQRYSMEHLFGDVWQGKDLSLQERSLITCTVLVALNREHEERAHFRGARNLGIPRQKLEAMITHVAHYAGWPVAATAMRVLDETWSQMDKEAKG